MKTPLVIGEWVRSLDGKGRVALPSVAAEVMVPYQVAEVMVGRLPGQTLAILSVAGFEQRLDKALRENNRAARRYLLACFHRAAVSSEAHRVTLPHTLREYAELPTRANVYLCGFGDGLRLMSAAVWAREMAALEAIARSPSFSVPRGIEFGPGWRTFAKENRLRVPPRPRKESNAGAAA